MNGLLVYLVKVSVILAILYLPYFLLFSKTTFFRLNRVYLIGSIACSLLFPAFNINLSTGSELVTAHWLFDQVVVTGNGQSTQIMQSIPGIRIPGILYISGTFIFGFLLLYRIYQIFSLVRRHGTHAEKGMKMVNTGRGFAPASFFSYVFLPANENRDEIIAHEQVHVRQGHSYDILFIELVKVLLWFNPFVWIYQASVRNLHEYLADEETLLKGYDRSGYQQLVFENTFGIRLSELAVNFNYSPIKQRLKMMTKNKTIRSKKWQYLFAMPVLTVTFLFFAGEPLVTNNLQAQVQKKDGDTSEKIPEKENVAPSEKEEVFIIVDEMPSFNGKNQEGFRLYIAENLVYPAEAIKNKIQGKVYIRFEVNSKGDLVNAKVVRSVDPLLDAEALRVIRSSPKWEPGKEKGKPVSVSFTFPVNFVLK